jgi:hypothetical protein
MSSVGETIQEAIDLMNSGSYEFAFMPTSRAVEETVRRSTQSDTVSETAIDRFIKENFQLIAFMGMPRALPLPMNVPFGLKRIVPRFNIHHGAAEILSLAINDTLKFKLFPAQFGFNSAGSFEIKKGKLLLPAGTVCGLLGSVIFNPVNTDENIGDRYWIAISDFKMFVSELFGRKDLADRIIKFYSG